MNTTIIIYIKDNYFIPNYIDISKNKLTFIQICNSDNNKHEIKYSGNNNEIVIYPNKSINIKFNLISRIELTLSSSPDAKCVVEVIEENSDIHDLGIDVYNSEENDNYGEDYQDQYDENDDYDEYEDQDEYQGEYENEYENENEDRDIDYENQDYDNYDEDYEGGEEDNYYEGKDNYNEGGEGDYCNNYNEDNNENKNNIENNQIKEKGEYNNNNNNNNRGDWNDITYHLNKPKNSKPSLEELLNSDQIGFSTSSMIKDSFLQYPNTDARGLLDKQRQEWNEQYSSSIKSSQSRNIPSNIEISGKIKSNKITNKKRYENSKRENQGGNSNEDDNNEDEERIDGNEERSEQYNHQQKEENENGGDDDEDEDDEEKGEFLIQREKIRQITRKYPDIPNNTNIHDDYDHNNDNSNSNDNNLNDNKNNNQTNSSNSETFIDSKRKTNSKIKIKNKSKRSDYYHNNNDDDGSDSNNDSDNDDDELKFSKNLNHSKLQNNLQLLRYKETIQITDYDFNKKNIIIRVGAPVEFLLDPKTPSHVEHVLEGRSFNSKLCFMSDILQLPYCDRFIFTPMVSGEIFVSCQIYTDMACRIVVLNPPPISTSTPTSVPTSIQSQNQSQVQSQGQTKISSTSLSSGIYDAKRKAQQHTQIYSPRVNLLNNNNNNGNSNPLTGSFPFLGSNSIDQLNSNEELNSVNSHNLPPFSPNIQTNNNNNNNNTIPFSTCILGVSEKLYIQPYHHSHSGPWSISSYGDSASMTSSCLDSDDCPDEDLFGLETTNVPTTPMNDNERLYNLNFSQEHENHYENNNNNNDKLDLLSNDSNLNSKLYPINQLNSNLNNFNHIVYVEDFKFQPSQLDIFINQTILFQSVGHASMHKLTCIGEFDGVALDSNNSPLTSSFYIHKFSNIGKYRVTNEIFSFMECQIHVFDCKTHKDDNQEEEGEEGEEEEEGDVIEDEDDDEDEDNYGEDDENERQKYYQYIKGTFINENNNSTESNNSTNEDEKNINYDYNKLNIQSPTRKSYDLIESISPPKVIQNHLIASVDWGLDMQELSDEDIEDKYKHKDTTSVLLSSSLSSSLSPPSSPITTSSITTSLIEKTSIDIELTEKSLSNNDILLERNENENETISSLTQDIDEKLKKIKKKNKLKKKGLETGIEQLNSDSIITTTTTTAKTATTTTTAIGVTVRNVNKVANEKEKVINKKIETINNHKTEKLKNEEFKKVSDVRNHVRNEKMTNELLSNLHKSEAKVVSNSNKTISSQGTSISLTTTTTTNVSTSSQSSLTTTNSAINSATDTTDTTTEVTNTTKLSMQSGAFSAIGSKKGNNLMNLLQTASEKKRSQDLFQAIPINKIDKFLNKRWEDMTLKLNQNEFDVLPNNKSMPIVRFHIE